MELRRTRNKIKRALYARVTLALLVIIAAFALNGTWEVYKKAAIAKKERDNIQTELGELTARKVSLKSSIGMLKTERGVEEEIRETFGVVKEGEEVVVIVDQPGRGKNGSSREGGGFWSSIASFFGFE